MGIGDLTSKFLNNETVENASLHQFSSSAQMFLCIWPEHIHVTEHYLQDTVHR